jgi:hypothetical protein
MYKHILLPTDGSEVSEDDQHRLAVRSGAAQRKVARNDDDA